MTVALYAAKLSASRLSRRGRDVRGTRSGAMIFSWMSCASLFVIESIRPAGSSQTLFPEGFRDYPVSPLEEFLSFDCNGRTARGLPLRRRLELADCLTSKVKVRAHRARAHLRRI